MWEIEYTNRFTDLNKLSGKYTGYRVCHLQPDWLSVWLPREEELILTFIDTATHSDLFG